MNYNEIQKEVISELSCYEIYYLEVVNNKFLFIKKNNKKLVELTKIIISTCNETIYTNTYSITELVVKKIIYIFLEENNFETFYDGETFK
ncbi:MAG: hypothetical protein ABIP51_15210 [Bacteroidia bacterium]